MRIGGPDDGVSLPQEPLGLIDPVGNIFGRREGSVDAAGTILFGSHIDTVPHGGNYDGGLGSLAAIELAQTLAEKGYRNRHPLEVVIWCDEESGLTGSRGYVGDLSEEDLIRQDRDGVTLAEKILRIGGDPTRIRDTEAWTGRVAAYLELHVEQGSVLDTDEIDIGVVEGFVGINHYDVTIAGVPNHAGTTPMGQRHNALLTASELVLTVDRIAQSTPGKQVGTVGRLLVSPGAQNVIPGEVKLTVELRDLDNAKIESVWERIRTELDRLAARYRTPASYTLRQSIRGRMTNPELRQAITEAAGDCGLCSKLMPSGAGHDAQHLAQICPTGMIFVPSVDGISHSPRENTRPEDVENGANVLLHTVIRLDRRPPSPSSRSFSLPVDEG